MFKTLAAYRLLVAEAVVCSLFGAIQGHAALAPPPDPAFRAAGTIVSWGLQVLPNFEPGARLYQGRGGRFRQSGAEERRNGRGVGIQQQFHSI